MAGVLLSGPAGAGKNALARDLLNELPDAVLLDFQSLYAAILGILRQDDGRFPNRQAHQSYALALAEYIRRAGITGAMDMELTPIVTNSDGDATRRSFLLGLLGPGSEERIIDPGIEVVQRRLAVAVSAEGEPTLTPDCTAAINRWYGRYISERRERRQNG